jgi:O-antigen/teichoic acid export membrane protein
VEWLSIATDDPAATLRWVRRVELAFVPFALLVAGLLLAKHSPIWWLCCASATLGLLCAAMMGPAIRRAENHRIDTAAWARRAEQLTAATFVVLAIVAVVVVYAFMGAWMALLLAGLFALSSAAASAVRRRAGSLRR